MCAPWKINLETWSFHHVCIFPRWPCQFLSICCQFTITRTINTNGQTKCAWPRKNVISSLNLPENRNIFSQSRYIAHIVLKVQWKRRRTSAVKSCLSIRRRLVFPALPLGPMNWRKRGENGGFCSKRTTFNFYLNFKLSQSTRQTVVVLIFFNV